MKFKLHLPLFSLYLLSGLMLGIGFIFPSVWIFGILGVAVLVGAIAHTHSLLQAVLGGFLAWTTKSLLAISWFWSTYPIEWIDLSLGSAEAPVVGIYWVTVSLFLGSGGVFVAGIWWFLNKRFTLGVGLLFFPFVWVFGELLSSVMFSICTYGPGGTINTVFSFGYLGYLLGNHDALLELARFGGVYILSFTGALLGYLVWFAQQIFSSKKIVLSVTGLCVALLISIGSDEVNQFVDNKNKETTTVAIIDTRFGGKDSRKADYDLYKYAQITEAVDAALGLDPAYIILPEDSRYTNVQLSAEGAYRFFRFYSADTSAIVIDSGRVFLNQNEATLRATIYDGISKHGWEIDKQYLVPQGEFMPYFYSISLSVIGMKEAITEINKKLSYRPGPLASQAHLPNVVPGILFCFESADPRGVRRLLKERSVPFIAHPISHAWFHESEMMWNQFDVMLKIQALWNKTNIVSAGNMVNGALYTSEGKKQQPSPVLSGEGWQVSLVSW